MPPRGSPLLSPFLWHKTFQLSDTHTSLVCWCCGELVNGAAKEKCGLFCFSPLVVVGRGPRTSVQGICGFGVSGVVGTDVDWSCEDNDHAESGNEKSLLFFTATGIVLLSCGCIWTSRRALRNLRAQVQPPSALPILTTTDEIKKSGEGTSAHDAHH